MVYGAMQRQNAGPRHRNRARRRYNGPPVRSLRRQTMRRRRSRRRTGSAPRRSASCSWTMIRWWSGPCAASLPRTGTT
jgi:hypothetical protein